MAREEVSLAILFADVAKSTHLYETLGDQTAQNLIGSCLSLLSEITEKYYGTVIKTIGDELMCTFPTANDAIEAAISMHQELEQLPVKDMGVETPPNIYVGIQYGDVIRESGDVFGDAVNVAARMVSLAKQRQIVTTEETVAQVPEDSRPEMQVIDRTTIKGKSGEVDIYEVVWEEQDVTVMLDDSMEDMTLRSRMEVQFRGRVIEVDSNRPSATMGRQSHNDVVVADNRVSRTHARIEYRRGKFVLIDQSSNGTYVIIQGKKAINLKRDEAPLIGNGVIGLGREVPPDSPEGIHYSIKM